MDDCSVSIVVAVYNMMRYLEQCLDSIASQTMRNIEIICVNDGSNDDSLDLLKRYAQNDDRFRVIDQENSGYGKAINNGISSARGTYVSIADPDDFVDADAYQKLYEAAEQNGFPDIVKANHYRYSTERGDAFVANYKEELCGRVLNVEVADGREVLQSIPAIWAALYRRDFLDEFKIRLSEAPGASYQDTGFVHNAWIAARSFYLVNDAFYHYRIDNAQSSIRSGGKVFRVCEEFDEIDAFDERLGKEELLAPALAAKRFTTYEWNTARLHDEEREQFIARAKADFERLRDSGVLREDSFEPRRWDALSLLLNRPMEYYASKTYGPQISTLTHENDALKRRVKSQEEEIRQNAESLSDMNRKLHGRNERIAKQKQKIDRYKRLSENRKRSLLEIKNSRSYRIGRAITWLPRRVKRLFSSGNGGSQ